MDKKAKINKDAVTKYEAMEKVLENLYGKVTEVRSSIREVFIMMKMLETQVGQLVGHPLVTKKNIRDNLVVNMAPFAICSS
jgi:CRISPR/Cas system-associated endonuclease Cas3-HD